jgi:hypothetical protein
VKWRKTGEGGSWGPVNASAACMRQAQALAVFRRRRSRSALHPESPHFNP